MNIILKCIHFKIMDDSWVNPDTCIMYKDYEFPIKNIKETDPKWYELFVKHNNAHWNYENNPTPENNLIAVNAYDELKIYIDRTSIDKEKIVNSAFEELIR